MNTSTPRKQLTTEYKQPSLWGAVFKLLFVVLFALVLLNAIFRVFVITAVKGDSMYPTYTHNLLLIMYSCKEPDTYKRGDIVVTNMHETDSDGNTYTTQIIKRVIGLPGDTLFYDIYENRLYINGTVYDEPYIAVDSIANGYDWTIGTYTVPDNHIFVMGDNRTVSLDSRAFGAIPYSDICGIIL